MPMTSGLHAAPEAEPASTTLFQSHIPPAMPGH